MRLPLVLLLLVATGGAALLAARCDLGSAQGGVLSRTVVDERSAPSIALEAPTREAAAPPSLRGRPVGTHAVARPRGVHVRVVGVTGLPLPHMNVAACWPTADSEVLEQVRGLTDAGGGIDLAGVPQDGTARVCVWPTGDDVPTRADDPCVTGPDLEVRVAYGLPATVRCLDGESGLEVDGVHVAWLHGRGAGIAFVTPGGGDSPDLEIHPAPGHVAWDPADWTILVGKWTRKLTAVYPLRRELDARVTVLDHQGRPESQAEVTWFTVAGMPHPDPSMMRAERLGSGEFRLPGLPFLRGEPLTVKATAPYLREPVTQTVALSRHPRDRAEMQIVLPAPGSQSEREAQSGSFGGRGPCSRFLRCGSHRRGAFELRVLRHDGTPASHATLFVGPSKVITDAEGVARDASFPTGTYGVRTATIGLLPITGQLSVVQGKTARLELRESRGGAIDVRVTDVDGDPLPFALLRVKMPSSRIFQGWVDEQDGVQRVDPFTDHLGQRRIARVETGQVEVRARWGSRAATARVLVREGQVVPVTLVAR